MSSTHDPLDIDGDGDPGTPLDHATLEDAIVGDAEVPEHVKDFNQDGGADLLDADDFARVMSGGKPLHSIIDEAGQLVIVPSVDTRTVYVHESGNDNLDGGTPSRPVRSLRRAEELVRDGYPDHVVIMGTLTGPIANQYGGWSKRGRSAAEPMVIRGEQNAKVIVPGRQTGFLLQGGAEMGNIVLQNIRFVPQDEMDAGIGLRIFSLASSVTIDGCTFEGFPGGVQILGQEGFAGRVRNVWIRRCQILDGVPGPGGGHAGGLYATNVDGLVVEDSLFDRCGWHPSRPEDQTIFSHNAYVRPDVRTIFRNCIFARASATGCQLRGGASWCVDSLFLDNPIHLTAGHAQMQYPQEAWRGGLMRNVLLGGADIFTEPRGFGIGLSRCNGGVVVDNLIGPMTGGSAPASWWIDGPNVRAPHIRNNSTFEPTGRFVRQDGPTTIDPAAEGNNFSNKSLGNPIDAYFRQVLGWQWDDPVTTNDFLTLARERLTNGNWDQRLTGKSIATWIRENVHALAHQSGGSHL